MSLSFIISFSRFVGLSLCSIKIRYNVLELNHVFRIERTLSTNCEEAAFRASSLKSSGPSSVCKVNEISDVFHLSLFTVLTSILVHCLRKQRFWDRIGFRR